MLSVVPRLTEEEQALLTVARRAGAVEPHHVLLSVLSLFYACGAITLLFAPDMQLFTQGTRPVFDLMPPLAWSVWFLAACSATVALLVRLTGPRQALAWLIVIPSQTVWIGAGLIAVLLQGSGSAMAVVFTVTVLLFTLATVWVTWRAFTSRKR